MAVGSVGGNFTLLQGYLNSGLSLNKYVSSLTDQNKTSFSPGSSSYFDNSLFQKLGTVGSSAVNLQSQIGRMASLTQHTAGVGKTASYSNKDILSASVANYADVSKNTTTNVNVKQLASGQQNKSAELDADENSLGDKFSISITNSAGKTTEFSVSLTDQDTNKTAMQAMEKKINASSTSTGIKATLELKEDEENGTTVSLLLSGEMTGKNNGKFTVEDNSAANLGNVSKESQNAAYSVNGEEFSRESNTVSLMYGVTATLNKTGSTQITYANDKPSAAIGAVQDFLDTFNNLLDAASGTKLKSQLTNTAGNSIRGLGYSGIGFDSSGHLSINDPNKLGESISNGSFVKNFQDRNSFGQKLYGVASNAYGTVYDSARKEAFNDLLSGLMNNAYGGGQSGSSFYPGMIFSMWA